MTPDERTAIESLAISLDREAEVPLGVQLAWAIRARVRDGRLPLGQRLPGLRELADAVGVNFNTVRSVYKRLENDGLVVTQQGSGTYVAGTAQRTLAVSDIASQAAEEARETGIDPRDIAAALYMTSAEPASPTRGAAARRHRLRGQIAALEQALGELQAKHPLLVPAADPAGAPSAPRLLGVDELEEQRRSLVQALAVAMATLEDAQEPDAPPETQQGTTAPRSSKRRSSRVRPRGKIAPAGA
jgi:DNA-binding transcriptional regulator YhcF (GntR family)